MILFLEVTTKKVSYYFKLCYVLFSSVWDWCKYVISQ